MRTIAVVAQKGGQAKSTTVVNMAACLAGRGSRVLVIDTDTQANATYVLLRGEDAPTADALPGADRRRDGRRRDRAHRRRGG